MEELDDHTVSCWGQLGLSPIDVAVCRYQRQRPNSFEPTRLKLAQCQPPRLTVIYERRSNPALDYEECLDIRAVPLSYAILAPKIDMLMTLAINEAVDLYEKHIIRVFLLTRERIKTALDSNEQCPYCLELLSSRDEIYVYLNWSGETCAKTVHALCSACTHRSMAPAYNEPRVGREFRMNECTLCFSTKGAYVPVATKLRF